MTCYTGATVNATRWFLVADGFSSTEAFCDISVFGGVWNARLIQGNVGETAAFVFVF